MPLPFTCTDCGVEGIARYVGVKPQDIQCKDCHDKRLEALGQKQVEQFKADIKDIRSELAHEKEQNLLLQRRLGRAMVEVKNYYGFLDDEGFASDFDKAKKRIMEGE